MTEDAKMYVLYEPVGDERCKGPYRPVKTTKNKEDADTWFIATTNHIIVVLPAMASDYHDLQDKIRFNVS